MRPRRRDGGNPWRRRSLNGLTPWVAQVSQGYLGPEAACVHLCGSGRSSACARNRISKHSERPQITNAFAGATKRIGRPGFPEATARATTAAGAAVELGLSNHAGEAGGARESHLPWRKPILTLAGIQATNSEFHAPTRAPQAVDDAPHLASSSIKLCCVLPRRPAVSTSTSSVALGLGGPDRIRTTTAAGIGVGAGVGASPARRSLSPDRDLSCTAVRALKRVGRRAISDTVTAAHRQVGQRQGVVLPTRSRPPKARH